jgi:hypothetical protein
MMGRPSMTARTDQQSAVPHIGRSPLVGDVVLYLVAKGGDATSTRAAATSRLTVLGSQALPRVVINEMSGPMRSSSKTLRLRVTRSACALPPTT